MRDSIRQNLRCLDCGSNRLATFRGNAFAPPSSYNQRPQFYADDSPPKNYKGKADKVTYQSDYDLTKANEQFKKLLDDGEEIGKEDVKEQPKVEKPKAEKFKDHDPSTEEIAEMLHKAAIQGASSAHIPIYNKTNSFFDDISCESKEKNEGSYNLRDDWQLQRSRNQQTFGSTGYAPRRPFYQQSVARGYYPPRKWNPEYARNQQTFGDDGVYNSFGGPSGGYYSRKRNDYSNEFRQF